MTDSLQPPTTPETFVFADEISATPQERAVLAKLGIRRNGAGALPALRTAARAADSAAKRHATDRATAWVAIIRGLVERVAAAAQRATWLETLCPIVNGRTVADALGNPARTVLAPEARERLDAWLGLHIFHVLSLEGVLSVALLDAWDTMRRTGSPRSNTPAAWIAVAKHPPLETEAIEKLLQTVKNTRLHDALKATLAALASDIPDPAALANREDTQEEPPTFVTLDSEESERTNNDAGDDGDGDGDNDVDIADTATGGKNSEHQGVEWKSLLGLLIHRSLHDGYRGHFGVTGKYGELPPLNLQRVCKALTSTLAAGTPMDSTRAAIAEVSLKLSLSPRRTLSLALQPNNDVWLDLTLGAICWNFDRVRDKRDRDDAEALPGRDVIPIPIRLSDRALSHLRELHGHRPAACSLRELADVSADQQALRRWLETYGEFLRLHGDSNYKAYSVRFARSYRSVYLDRGHGAIAAAFLGMDFCTVPPGLLHYISIPQSRLTAWQWDVDSYLGLNWTESALETC
jgi:hypothetical protein